MSKLLDSIFGESPSKRKVNTISVPYYAKTALPYSQRMGRLETIYEQVKSGELTSIDGSEVKKLSFSGIPDHLRAFYWKLIIGYLSWDTSEWESHLYQQRELYFQFYDQFIPDCQRRGNEDKFEERKEYLESVRLSDKKKFTLLNEINKDVHRTFPHFHFFQMGFDEDALDSVNPHSAALRRILFIWSNLNPGISYVQGMNEVVGPLYYLFATDPDNSEFAEEDAFGCFTILMGEIMNNFCKTLDTSEVGVVGQIRLLNSLLKKKDYEMWQFLEDLSIDPRFYTFRWLTLMLSQEFELPDVFRLWDSFFSDPNRYEYLLYVSCAMILHIKEELMSLDFADCLKLLQNYPPIDVDELLNLANRLYDPQYGIASPLDEINSTVSKFLSKIPF